MTDHKFEPFQKVLVRSGDKWVAAHFSHIEPLSTYKFCCTSGLLWAQCIPYAQETAHLLGTSQPYEPPNPPVEYEWGQKVEVCAFIGEWEMALYIGRAKNNDILAILEDDEIIRQFSEDKVRPLSDDPAAS